MMTVVTNAATFLLGLTTMVMWQVAMVGSLIPAWGVHGAPQPQSVTHTLRLDLKPRNMDWLDERAEAVSRPFPHNQKPASWEEIFRRVGRTQDELEDLESHVIEVGGILKGECPSKLCLIIDVDLVDDQEELDQYVLVEEFVQGNLHRSLQEAGKDHTIVSRVRYLKGSAANTAEDSRPTGNPRRERRTQESSGGSDPPPFPGSLATDLSSALQQERITDQFADVMKNLNEVWLTAVPLPCNIDCSDTECDVELAATDSDCSQDLSLEFNAWGPEYMAVDVEPVTAVISSDDLAEIACGDAKSAVSNCTPEVVTFEGNNVTLLYTDETAFKIINFGEYLPPGYAYYNGVMGFNVTLNATNLTQVYYNFPTAYPLPIGPTITPDYGNNAYNVPKGHQGKGLGVTALTTLLNAYSPSALEAANTAFNLPTPEIQLLKSKLFPAMNFSLCADAGGCIESNLDIQMITQYGTGASFGFIPSNVNIDSTSDYDAFVGYRESFVENDVMPDVLSLSYGGGAAYDEEQDTIMKEFVAAGITILVATGDRGAVDGGVGSEPCDPTNFVANTPANPAMSPWALAVGATAANGLGPAVQTEGIQHVACMGPTTQSITSTGKIYDSDVLPVPDYQRKAVTDYVESTKYKDWPFQPRHLKSSNVGRGIPDVSALGANIPLAGETPDGTVYATPVGGTSAATPAFAGLLLQVRAELLDAPECAGKFDKFGRINDMVYWAAEFHPAAFTDITIGNNVFDGQGDFYQNIAFCGQGFTAAKGWDPVTGVGMMNFPGFVEAAKIYYCIGIDGNGTPLPDFDFDSEEEGWNSIDENSRDGGGRMAAEPPNNDDNNIKKGGKKRNKKGSRSSSKSRRLR